MRKILFLTFFVLSIFAKSQSTKSYPWYITQPSPYGISNSGVTTANLKATTSILTNVSATSISSSSITATSLRVSDSAYLDTATVGVLKATTATITNLTATTVTASNVVADSTLTRDTATIGVVETNEILATGGLKISATTNNPWYIDGNNTLVRGKSTAVTAGASNAIESNYAGAVNHYFNCWSSTDANTVRANYYKIGNSTIGSYTATVDGENLVDWYVGGSDATSLNTSTLFRFTQRGTAGSLSNPGRMTVYCGAGGATAITSSPAPLIIDASGVTHTDLRVDSSINVGRKMIYSSIADTVGCTIVAGTGIPATALKHIIRVTPSAAVDITANPQIVDGTTGEVIMILGTSDVNTLKLDDGTGLQLAGGASFTLGNGDIIQLVYSAALDLWVEISRSDN